MEININNISVGYSKNNYIIRDLTTSFSEGGICGILGPNGSGKTTLLRAISGTLSYNGSISIQTGTSDKIEIKSSNRKLLARYISMTPQFSSTYFSYNVYETILMGRYSHTGSSFSDMLGGTNKNDKEIVDRYISHFGLDDIRNKSINELSGGQMERVLLARTFAQTTPIILLDEPTNHLDIKYQSELTEYLKEWIKGTTEVDGVTFKNTIISVFHDIGLAAYLADEIVIMKEGNIIKKGPKDQVLNDKVLKEVYDVDVVSYLNKTTLQNPYREY